MSFFKVSVAEENVEDYSGGNSKYMNSSGIYDIVIKAAVVDTTPNGSKHINLFVEHDGQLQPIYQAMRLTNNDGSANLGAKLFNKLCIVMGATEDTEISEPVSRMVPMGKGGADVECMVLEEFDDVPVTLRLQMEYSLYEGKIRENKAIRNFFRYEDKATAAEIVNNSEEKGKQFSKEEGIADTPKLNDGLTEEDITEWKKNLSSGAKEKTEATPKKGFGQKRTFGKK